MHVHAMRLLRLTQMPRLTLLSTRLTRKLLLQQLLFVWVWIFCNANCCFACA
jgi:hypothetical protein